MNNLQDVTVDIPKRRLTVFTGVSGSGKTSLVFGTIAAESQRLDGLTTAILVDQERMGANVRSTVGTVTDTNALLRILFSRLGQPHIGPPNAFSFNVASVRGAGAITVEKAGGKKVEKRTFERAGGMCTRCEGTGNVTDFDLNELTRPSPSSPSASSTTCSTAMPPRSRSKGSTSPTRV